MKRDCEQFLASLPEGSYDSVTPGSSAARGSHTKNSKADASEAAGSEVLASDVCDQQIDDQTQLDTSLSASLDASQRDHLSSCADCRLHLEAVDRHVKLLCSLTLTSSAQEAGIPERLSSPEFLEGIYERALEGSGARDDKHGDQHVTRLFAAIENPSSPEELSSPEFFAGIIDRAAKESEARVSPALAEGLQPVKLPAQRTESQDVSDPVHESSAVHWTDSLVVEESVHASALRSLTQSSTPGWLWSHIRSEVQAVRAQRLGERSFAQRRMFIQVTAAAAIITVSALLYSNFFDGKDTNKDLRAQIQFVRSNRPLEATPSSIVAGASHAETQPGSSSLSNSLGGLGNVLRGGVRHGG